MNALREQIAYCRKRMATEGPIYKDLLNSLLLLESCEVLPKDIDKGQYQRFFNRWYQFRTTELGSKPRMTREQGAALKQIIRHLTRVSGSRNYEGAFKGWELILENWSKLSPYLQKQISLVQVNENLEEILMQLFKGGNNGKTETGSIAPNTGNTRKPFGRL